MDFDKEVLDALAHLNSAPAAPTNIKTFKSVTPSPRSPPPAGEPGGFASDSDGVHTDAYDGESDEVVSVTRTEILLMQLVRVTKQRRDTRLES